VNIYYPVPNSDIYDCLNFSNTKDWRILDHFLGYQQYDEAPKTWKPISVEIELRGKSGEFPSLLGHTLVFSEKAWKILQSLIKESVELLPLTCNSSNYNVIKVINVVDCLDYSRANVKRFQSSGRVMHIVSYAFKDEHIENRNIFQLPEPKNVLVSQAFKDCVENEGLEGLIFRQVA
jgi:hypothetical protein